MAFKYGDVFTIYLGGNPTIIVAHQKSIRELLLHKGKALLDRPEVIFLDIPLKEWGKNEQC